MIFGIFTEEIDVMKYNEPLNDIDYKLQQYRFIVI